MPILEILIFPDTRLRTVAKTVSVFNEEIDLLSQNMLQTMYQGEGIGLAGTQVNVHKRIIVIDISNEKDQPMVFINPEIKDITSKKELPYSEGCLSVPGFYEEIERPSEVLVVAQNTKGEIFETLAEGILSVVIQHEIDHLEGKMMVDYLSNLKRERIRKKLLKGGK